ncbi:hypothetical protein WJX75_000195 [Coccomyxa subellipsoidea]|uniref:Uncharacterized protein n=1 Tax=Coccomyxa subellipsoidea TaxID=248742 RepID=A0ABR2YSQ9_9CHLO
MSDTWDENTHNTKLGSGVGDLTNGKPGVECATIIFLTVGVSELRPILGRSTRSGLERWLKNLAPERLRSLSKSLQKLRMRGPPSFGCCMRMKSWRTSWPDSRRRRSQNRPSGRGTTMTDAPRQVGRSQFSFRHLCAKGASSKTLWTPMAPLRQATRIADASALIRAREGCTQCAK